MEKTLMLFAVHKAAKLTKSPIVHDTRPNLGVAGNSMKYLTEADRQKCSKLI